MQNFAPDLASLRTRLDEAAGYLRIAEQAKRRAGLETEMADPDLWNDQDRGRRVQKDLASVIEDLDLHAGLTGDIEEAETLVEMAVEEADDSLEGEITAAVASLGSRFDELELRSLFSGQYDEGDAVCQVQSGAGGTDAQDWLRPCCACTPGGPTGGASPSRSSPSRKAPRPASARRSL